MFWTEDYEDESDFVEQYALGQWVDVTLHTLRDDDRRALELYFGIDPRGPMTLKEVGVILADEMRRPRPLSIERAGQLVRRGLRCLRHPERCGDLRPDPVPEGYHLFPTVFSTRPRKQLPPHIKASLSKQARAFNRHTWSNPCSQIDI